MGRNQPRSRENGEADQARASKWPRRSGRTDTELRDWSDGVPVLRTASNPAETDYSGVSSRTAPEDGARSDPLARPGRSISVTMSEDMGGAPGEWARPTRATRIEPAADGVNRAGYSANTSCN